MNWNAIPERVTLPPLFPKNQSSFLDPTLINMPSQVSLNSPGSNQAACMYLSNLNSVSQPPPHIRNYNTPQQIAGSDMHSGTVAASQSSVERITYANMKAPKQLSHSFEMSSGVAQNAWLNSLGRNSMFSHTGTTVSQQTGFRTNTSNGNALQNQSVTLIGDTYSMQVQMIPSNSGRDPVPCQGNQRLNSSLSEQQGDWAQPYTSNGVTYPDYRPLPKQYSYPSQSFLQNATLQKQKLVSPTSLQVVKNNHPSNSALILQSKQTASVQAYKYAVTQTDRRPPPPPYDCRYASLPLQNTQYVTKQSSIEIPQSQEAHLPEMRKDYCRGFEQENLNENVRMIGNFCNMKGNTDVSQPVNPIRPSMGGVQILAQNNKDEKGDASNLTSNQVLDTRATKEKLVRDIKTLIEMKKKFSELARKIKINKNVLMAAGCVKTTKDSYSKDSYSKSAQNSELSLQQNAKIQFGPQVRLVTPETADDRLTVMETAEEANRTHCALNSSVQDTTSRNFNRVNSILLNSVSSEKVPVPELHNLKVRTLKTSTVEDNATFNNTQFPSGNLVHMEGNVPTNSETTYIPQSMALEEYASKYLNKNKLLFSLLTHGDKIEKLKDACETIQYSKPHSFETNSNIQICDNEPNMKTMVTPSTCNINTKVSDSSFSLELKSSNGLTLKSDTHCSVELLATCLSLWKKQSSEPTGIKQCNESTANGTSIAISKPTEICDSPLSVVGNSQNQMVNCSLVTTLPVVVQNSEPSGTTITKGTEPQIAVVSPLILSDVKTLSVKAITSDSFPETLYPVIKEGSVCSLQNQLSGNAELRATSKVSEPVSNTSTNTKIFPLIQKEKQNESTNTKSEDIPNSDQGKCIKPEPDIHCLTNDQQALTKSRDNDIVSNDVLQIDNICSLVEGDTSYNSQIAKIFNSPPMKKVEPQKFSLPKLEVLINEHQKEQLDNITENTDSITEKKDFCFHKDTFVQCMDVAQKIQDESKSLQRTESSLMKNVEANSEILEENDLEHITKKESTAKDTCPSAAVQPDNTTQEIDVSSNCTAQDPARNEILDEEISNLYPHDQLSELLKAFPYGIEAVNTVEDSLPQQITDQILKDKSCDKTSCDSKDSTDQIKITILNSEQMKEIFPEQNDELFEGHILVEPQKENPVTKEGTHCASQVHTVGEGCNSVVDAKQDDTHLCALGCLCVVNEGMPQCRYNSIKDKTSKVEKDKDQCSLETNSSKQGEKSTSEVDVPLGFNSPPNSDLNIAVDVTFLNGRNHFPVIEPRKSIKETPKTKNSSLRTEKELPDQPLSTGGKTLDCLKSHKKKGNLKFHEITFHSSNEVISPENLQKKVMSQKSCPLKAKSSFFTNKSKDLPVKNDSLVQPILPIKRKSQVDIPVQNVSGKRKLGEGNNLDLKVKRMKYDKHEQTKRRGSIFKICNFLSNPDDRAKVKEKTVSDMKSSGSKDSVFKMNGVPTQYLQRQKNPKVAVGIKATKKSSGENVPCDSQYTRSHKLTIQAGSLGKSKRHSSSLQISKESLNICTSYGKNLKTQHSEGSKAYLSGNVKETGGGKQSVKMWINKTKLDKNLNNGVEANQISAQAKDQRKQYLNRVAFKCTERESICLTKLENLPKKFNKEKRLENKPKKDITGKQSMLQFKLCPDELINKNAHSIKEQKDLQPCPRKEQAPAQVTGIKSTKEDWIKGVPEEKRIPEANQEIGICNSEPLGRLLHLHSDPGGSQLCAMDAIVPDIAVGTKWGLDKLVSACNTNGPFVGSSNSTATTEGNDRKKLKGDNINAGAPSRVIHVGNLPRDVTWGEVISLGLPFGKVTNFLIQRREKQAFIEMNTEETANTVVNYYTSVTPVLRGQLVSIQFSNQRELKTDNSANPARVKAAVPALSSAHSGNLALADSAGTVMAGQSPVLRVVVENLFYPVNLDILYQVFSKFGTVLKIITFTKNNQFQVLLQYADPTGAQQAKLLLNGQNIYNFGCTLRISFSKYTNLYVKYNNDRSRDYTHLDLPSSNSQSSLDQTLPAAFGVPGIRSASPYVGGDFPPTFAITQGTGLFVPNVREALAPLSVPLEAAAGRVAVSGLGGTGNSVLLLSNLNLERVTAQSLFILFGLYGNVHQVSILLKKQKALVQMADGSQALLAMSLLRGLELYGKPVHIMLSKYRTILLPSEGQEDLTQDYRHSSLHRFKKPGSKNFKNICPPSSSLYLSNIPPSISKDDLKILFSSNGRIVKGLRFFKKNRKIALIQMGSVEEAIQALIELQNHDLGENHYLQVSFSKLTTLAALPRTSLRDGLSNNLVHSRK